MTETIEKMRRYYRAALKHLSGDDYAKIEAAAQAALVHGMRCRVPESLQPTNENTTN